MKQDCGQFLGGGVKSLIHTQLRQLIITDAEVSRGADSWLEKTPEFDLEKKKASGKKSKLMSANLFTAAEENSWGLSVYVRGLALLTLWRSKRVYLVT